jgi:SAM-dependent methyltransferase
VDRIVATSPGADGADVLDVGCGTGIAARQFQAAGCRVLGVDPDGRMADLTRQRGIEVEVAKFEDWDPAGRTFDAVIAGQAWHWVDPVAGAVKAAQALRPGGRLAVFWNVFQPPREVGEAFAAVHRQAVPESSASFWTKPMLDVYSPGFTKAADGIRAASAFSDPEQWRFDWDRPYTRDEWLEQVPTFGGVSQLPPAKLQEILAGIGAAIATKTGVSSYQKTPGNLGAQMWTRDLGDGRTEVMMVSWWSSRTDIEAFAGQDIDVAVFYPEDDDYLVDRETTVMHYDVARAV